MPDVRQRLQDYFGSRTPSGIVSVYLFGSRAEGRAHREGDMDVGVLLDWTLFPTSAERFEARILFGSELIHATGTNEVDVVILNDAPPGLGRAVVTRGLRI